MPGRFQRRVFRPHTKGIPSFVVPVLVAVLLCVCFFYYFSTELRPIIETVAVSRATNLISSEISGTVDDCISASGLQYSDFISMEKNANGDVTSLTGRPAESNRFKRQVIEEISSSLNEISAGELAIPIGNLTGNLLLSGLGPEIRVSVHTIGEITATYRSSFAAAGVNQTHHGIYLDITATVHLLIPGEIISVTVTDSICIAETIILGEVPNTYIQLEKGES